MDKQIPFSFFVKRSMILILIIALFSSAFSQDQNPFDIKVIPPGPEAAALGKYIDMPVSTYTGLPSISIPIYDLKSYYLSVPISLSYHASGINMDEIASFVGAGWSLNAGGIVSRSVRGLEDEHDYGYLQTTSVNNSYGVDPYFTPAGEIDYNYIENSIALANGGNCTSGYSNLYYASRGGLDLEPDQFFFSLPDGQSGKFVYDRQKNVHLVPRQFIDIDYTQYSTGKFFKSFVLTGRDGTRYYFDVVEESHSTSYGSNPLVTTPGEPAVIHSPSVVSTWKLTRIETSNGEDWINFEYVDETLVYDLPVSVTTYDKVSLVPDIVDNPATLACGQATTIYSKRISAIKTKAGYEVYFYSQAARQDVDGGHVLDSIRVQYKDVELKTVRLTHDYIVGTGDPYNNRLLMLSSVQEYKAAHPLAPSYALEYYPEISDYQRNSKAVDHWGYSNGASGNAFKSPAVIYNNQFYLGADREANLEYCRQWTLKKITYPTGGTSEYDYELHDYSNIPSYTDVRYSPGLEELTKIEFQYTGNINDNYSKTITFTLAEATDVVYLYDIPTIPGGGIPMSGCGGTLTKSGSPAYSFNFLSGGGNGNKANIISIPAGTYTLTASYTPSTFTWDSNVPGFPFYIKIYKVKTQEQLLADNGLKGGGLRIKSITATGDNEISKSYKYTYRNSTVSSGKLMSFPLYTYFMTFNKDYMYSPVTCVLLGTDLFLARTAVSNYPLTQSSGSYVGYDEVTEYYGDDPELALPHHNQFGNNGFSVYQYENHPDEDAARNFPITPKTDYSHTNGFMREQLDYTRDGKLIREVSNTYSFSDHERMGFGIKIAEGTITSCVTCGSRKFVYATYEQVSDLIRLSSSRVKTWDENQGSYQEITTEYTYDDFDQVISIAKDAGISDRIIQTSYEYHPVNHTAHTKEYTAYVNTSAANPRDWITSPQRGQKIVYDANGLIPQELWLLATETENAPTPDDNLFEKRLVYDIVAPTGKIRQYHKVSEAPTSIIWGYGTAGDLFPIAQVINADTASIAYTSFESPSSEKGGWSYDTTPAALNDISVTGKVSYHSVAAIQTNKLISPGQYIISYWATAGSLSITDTNNAAISAVDYVPAKTLGLWTLYTKRITLSQATAIKVNLASSGISLDELRLYPAGAQMTTYTYDVDNGMTSTTDANNTTLYYSFDDKSRLQEIKDANRDKVKRIEYHYQRGDN